MCVQQQGVSVQLCLLSLVGYAPAVQSGHTRLTDHQSMPEAYRTPPTSPAHKWHTIPYIVNRAPFGMHNRLKPHMLPMQKNIYFKTNSPKQNVSFLPGLPRAFEC